MYIKTLIITAQEREGCRVYQLLEDELSLCLHQMKNNYSAHKSVGKVFFLFYVIFS